MTDPFKDYDYETDGIKLMEINLAGNCEEIVLRRRLVNVRVELTDTGATILFDKPEGGAWAPPIILQKGRAESAVIKTAAVLKESK